MKTRLTYIDTAKGLGILLVVYGHVLRGLMSAGITSPTGWAATSDTVLYAFHMPLFFLLSGVFFRAEKYDHWWAGIKERLLDFVPVYLIWNLLQSLMTVGFAGSVNTKVSTDPLSLVTGLLVPKAQFWFLQALLFVIVFLSLASRLPRWKLWVLPVSFGLALLPVLTSWARYTPVFALGAVLTVAGLVRLIGPLGTLLSVVVFGALLPVLLHLPTDFSHTSIAWVLLDFALGVSGTLVVVGLSERLPLKLQEPLATLGKLSMPIYLAHILFTAGTRIALQKVLHYQGVAGHIVLGTIVGTLAPLVLYKLAERLKCTWVLGVRAAKPKSSTS